MQEFEIEEGVTGNNESSGMGGLEIIRLILSIKKSLVWLILFLSISVTACYYYLRYSKPVYLASSLIKLDVMSEAADIGMAGTNPFVKQMDNLQGEIELIKSPLVAEAVINSLDIDVTYSAIGTVLTTELYRNSPFKVKVLSADETIIRDVDFHIHFINDTEFKLFQNPKEEKIAPKYKIGEIIDLSGFKLAIIWDLKISGIGNQKEYTIRFNSKGSLISYLLNNVAVEIVNQSARTISIAFTDYNRDKAVSIVNAFDSVYLKQSLERKQMSQEQTLSFIENQLESTSRKLEESEKEIEYFIRKHKTTSPSAEFSGVMQKIATQEELILENSARIKTLDDLLKFIQKESAEENILPLLFGLDNPQITSGINALNELYKQRELLKISSKETTTPFRKIELEVSILKSQLLGFILENKKQLNEQQKVAVQKVSEYKGSFAELPGLETELKRLERYNSLFEKFYMSLLDRQIQFQIAKAGTVPEFTILSPARASWDPIHPDTKKIWLFFIVGGLAPGLLMIVIRYLMLNIILDPKEAEKKIHPPVLGLIPAYKKKMDASTLVVDNNPKSSISEALRSIRSNAGFIMENKPHHFIGVTSTISGEGKTMFAINYAAIMALSGKKVVILDFDMRKPKIHIGFGVPNNVGSSTILVGQTKWKDAIRKTRLANLDFITSGPTPPNPAELILRKEFDQLIYDLFEEYDVVMIDTPPIGLVTDASNILNKTDLSVYVIRSGYSHKSTISNVNQLYASKKLKNLSVIINDVDLKGGYGYKYSYGYGYGYGYYEEDHQKKSWFSKWFKK